MKNSRYCELIFVSGCANQTRPFKRQRTTGPMITRYQVPNNIPLANRYPPNHLQQGVPQHGFYPPQQATLQHSWQLGPCQSQRLFSQMSPQRNRSQYQGANQKPKHNQHFHESVSPNSPHAQNNLHGFSPGRNYSQSFSQPSPQAHQNPSFNSQH